MKPFLFALLAFCITVFSGCCINKYCDECGQWDRDFSFQFQVDTTASGFLRTEIDTILLVKMDRGTNTVIDSTLLTLDSDNKYPKGSMDYSITIGYPLRDQSGNDPLMFDYKIIVPGIKDYLLEDFYLNIEPAEKNKCCSCAYVSEKRFQMDGAVQQVADFYEPGVLTR